MTAGSAGSGSIPITAPASVFSKPRPALPSRLRTKLALLKLQLWVSLKATLTRTAPWQKRRAARRLRRLNAALAEIERFPKHSNAPRHNLPAPLIVSLTSYPARFPSLALTVKSLIDQTVRPDQIVLWIAHENMGQLPEDLLALQDDIFMIRACDDLRSFKKIIPSLNAYPDAFILICDDDSYYPDGWLDSIVAAYDPAEPTVVCRRAHRLRYQRHNELAPYQTWFHNISDARSAKPSRDLLPTGNGGVLYPPGALPKETTDVALFGELSPSSDDVWLFFMSQRAQLPTKRVRGWRPKLVEWPNTQEQALRDLHRGGLKDQHITRMCAYFGTP